jgi:hypothetical protein
LPSVQNQSEIENRLLEIMWARVQAGAFEYLSTLIEQRIRDTGPAWLREATVLQSIENYLRSGIRFAYLQAGLAGTAAGPEDLAPGR